MMTMSHLMMKSKQSLKDAFQIAAAGEEEEEDGVVDAVRQQQKIRMQSR